MTEEELLALYALVRKEAETLRSEGAILEQRSAALNQAIAKLEQLPLTLGTKTSEYIAQGVKRSIQDDFKRPIAEAIKGPIAELTQATERGRIVMEEVGKESRYNTWPLLSLLGVGGIILGVVMSYIMFGRSLDKMDDRLDVIQQQVMAKPTDGKAAKGKRAGY